MKEEMAKAAELLLKLADENKTLKGEVVELKAENSTLKKEKKAEKIANLMAERGMIESDLVHEKVASLMTEDNLEPFEAAVDLMPKGVEIGTVEEKEKTAALSEDESDLTPMEVACYKHLGVL